MSVDSEARKTMANVSSSPPNSSSSNDTEDEEDSVDHKSERKKRSVNCTWPPDPNEPTKWNCLRSTRAGMGNPEYGPRMQLFCSTGWHLAIYNEHDVRGSIDEHDPFTFFELSYAGVPGHVRIRSLRNGLYLAMNRLGRLYGEKEMSQESTVFIESLAGSYNVYLSRKFAHLGWYLALKKSGRMKKGPKTALKQKAVKFLPRRSNLDTFTP